MKKCMYIMSLAGLVALTGCAASSTQSQLASVKNPMRNASSTIKLTNQQVRIMKNTQQFTGTVQKPAQ